MSFSDDEEDVSLLLARAAAKRSDAPPAKKPEVAVAGTKSKLPVLPGPEVEDFFAEFHITTDEEDADPRPAHPKDSKPAEAVTSSPKNDAGEPADKPAAGSGGAVPEVQAHSPATTTRVRASPDQLSEAQPRAIKRTLQDLTGGSKHTAEPPASKLQCVAAQPGLQPQCLPLPPAVPVSASAPPLASPSADTLGVDSNQGDEPAAHVDCGTALEPHRAVPDEAATPAVAGTVGAALAASCQAMDVAEGVMAPTHAVEPEPAAAPPASNAPPAVAAHTGQKALPSGDPSLQPEHPATQPPQQHANHAPPHPPQATPVQPRPAPASAPPSEPVDSSSKSGTQAGSLASAAAPDLGHLSAPVAVTIRPIRPRSTPVAGSRPTPLLTKRLSGGVSERSGTQPAAPAAPSPGPVSQQATLAAPGTKASAALSSPAVSLVGKALQQASPNSTSSGSKGTPLTSPALSSGTKGTPLTSPALSSGTKGTPLTSPALSSGTKTVPLITQVAKPPAAGANVSPKLAMLARSEAAAAAAAPPRTAGYESSAAAVTGPVKMANVPVRPGHHSSVQQLVPSPAVKSDEDTDSKQLAAHQPITPSVQQPAPMTPASSLEVAATAAAMPVSASSSRKPGEAAATSVSPAPNLAPASPQTSHTSASRQPGHAGPLAPAAPAPAASSAAAAAAELPTSSRAASPNLPVFSDARQGSSSSSAATAESEDKAPSPHPTAASHPQGLPCTLPVLPAEPSGPAQQALAAAPPAATTSHQPAYDSSLEMDDRARPPNPSALPCGDAAVSRHVPAATLAQAMALVRGSKAAAPAEEALTAAGGSKAVAAWMQDYSATVERLELMVLQAQQMQMEVLEVRAQAAILQNRTVRLDNPKLRSRLVDVMDRYHTCIAMPVPPISQYLTT